MNYVHVQCESGLAGIAYYCLAIPLMVSFTVLTVAVRASLCTAAISQQSKALSHCLMLCFDMFL